MQDHLDHPLRVPAIVKKWSNFCDRLDPVAFDKSLANDFPSNKITIDDKIVINRNSLQFRGFDPHSSTGYLQTQQIRSAMREVLGNAFIQPHARFLIARDLAADMANTMVRHSVLIEMDEKLPGDDLKKKRDELVKTLETITDQNERAEIDALRRRYVAARLTQQEIDRLSVKYKNLRISRFWKNLEKQALLDKSAKTIQAYTARLGTTQWGTASIGLSWIPESNPIIRISKPIKISKPSGIVRISAPLNL